MQPAIYNLLLQLPRNFIRAFRKGNYVIGAMKFICCRDGLKYPHNSTIRTDFNLKTSKGVKCGRVDFVDKQIKIRSINTVYKKLVRYFNGISN